MGRKPKIATDDASPLSSNPFAALHGALGELPTGEPPPDEPARASSPGTPEATAIGGGARPGLGGKIVVRRQKKGRGGRTATVIEGLALSDAQRAELAQAMRRTLGCGAHVEGATIVVMGAQTERIRDWLGAQGARKVVIGS